MIESERIENMKKKKEKSSLKEKLLSDKSLIIFFVFMLTFVLVLVGFLIHRKLNEKPKANMLIAIMEKGKKYSFHINSFALADVDGYLIKVVNYRGPTINQEDINFSITFSNPTKSKISVKRLKNMEEVGEELMENQDSTKVDNQKLEKEKENEIWYKISVVQKGDVKNNDLIGVLIES